MKRLFIAVLMILSVTTAFAQIVNKAEYFFDNDPGPGNGTPISISTPGVSVTFPAQIPINLSPGFHWLGIRVKDSDGKWSLFQRKDFYVSQPSSDLPIITKAEYFFDTDPGVGSGTPLNFQTTGFSVSQTFPITVPVSMTGGTHYLAIRVKDQAGHWSLFQRDTIVVGAASTITCPGNVVVSAAAGQCSAVVNNIDAVTSPSGASYTYTMNGATIGTGTGSVSGKTFNAGVTTVTYALNSTPSINCSFTVTVNANIAPSVSISQSPTMICSGTITTFTATPVNGGSTPAYQWKVNDVNVGNNSNTYVPSVPVNGNVVKVIMTSSLGCANPPSATSNSITMVVNDSVQEYVSITASATTICAGTPVTFTAAESGGGSGTFQWKLNGNNVGTNSLFYRNDSLHNGDKVKVVFTPTYACSPSLVSSNEITITVNSAVTPSVSILPSATNICAGQQVTFTATPVNGGATPSYQWKLNGNNVGSNSPTYQNSALQNDDVIKVVMTSSLASVCQPTATSNSITMSVGQTVIPSVSITPTATTICNGQSVTFTATPTNGGNNPNYEWTLNGSIVGNNSNTYQTSTLHDGDVIKVGMQSSLSCANPGAVYSNTIAMSVGSGVTPSVSIYASQTSICTGWLVKFYANPVNGGDAPIYQWKLNGNNVGTNSGIFQSTTLNDNDVVRVVMTSSLTCAGQQPVESNTVTITVGIPVMPSVSIEADNTTICSGTLVTFTAHPTNGGNTPLYLWRINGNDVGDYTDTYQSSTLANGDSIQAIITSSLNCAIISTAISNTIKMTVTQAITYYADKDGDGYGDATDSVVACGLRAGFVTNKSDCNDNNASIYPGAAEICGNGIDDNCNGQTDENCTESLPTLITKTYPVKEGDAGFTIVNVEVTLDTPATKPISVNYATSNANATAGSDYVAANGVLTIPVGAISGNLQLKVIGDLLREDNEIFWLTFSNPVNVLLSADPRTRIMIIDDDKGKPNSASPNKDAVTEVIPFKIPTVAKRNTVWMIPQIGNYENEVLILNVQGQIVNRFINYQNQTSLANVSAGLYFYRIRIMENPGQYKYYSGRLLITE